MNNEANQSQTGVTVVGIDIGKDVFHVVGFEGGGQIVLRRKIRRLANAPKSLQGGIPPPV